MALIDDKLSCRYDGSLVTDEFVGVRREAQMQPDVTQVKAPVASLPPVLRRNLLLRSLLSDSIRL